ncbi:hypothetical protein SIN8267_00466 [Sinobacterium norvegicum]|uniref:GNAT family N-acetyltransferase n=1 Tax=Sinobacterium norvegicum TaxID=1641715 RepID=A0ABN8ED31_9GAMM|nr:GNAT family N-acetyltransferase [Sinobacterium norvegicum]CAH0990374.1 hypothetical protein SIN8267_00466 [Sinobacterium norvegicum]
MINIQYIDSINAIDKALWNNTVNADYPFLQHQFLQALEDSGAVTTEKGWQPNHGLIYDDERLIGIIPLYFKSHSYGEYVFDFEWANAYHRNQLQYYPKLLSAIPYTPATGPRLCLIAPYDNAETVSAVCEHLIQYAQQHRLSSCHILFSDPHQSSQLKDGGLSQRRAVHFQWHNKQYRDFDHYLSTFNARKRKNCRKERRCLAQQQLSVEYFNGDQIDDQLWRQFGQFYQATYAKRSGHGGYLPVEFFSQLGRNMADSIVLMTARGRHGIIAGALYFKDATTLYGRYWGCAEEFDNLHFELCYYQGIEYCINHKLQRFDPGVQGEHKIQRGFEPNYTYSNHWLAHPSFAEAIDNFLQQESPHIEQYKADCEQYLPFKSVLNSAE